MKKIIIANWKMNPESREAARALASATDAAASKAASVNVAVAPPFPYLGEVAAALKHASLGAQDVFWEKQGAYTGEVSARQLKDAGASHVIVGHSERRMYLGETDEMIGRKTRAALEEGMTAVVCVGERERDGAQTPSVVASQTRAALAGLKRSMLKRLIIAYEPVWAISTSRNTRGACSPDDMFRARLIIEKTIAGLFGDQASRSVRIIYGGSVDKDNIAAALADGRMDGALVGGASLDPDAFAEILRRAAAV